jgi:RNA polymerase primary sigma factor
MSVQSMKKRRSPVPRKLRKFVEENLQEDFTYIDSPKYRRTGIEQELFGNPLPGLPSLDWYYPTLLLDGEDFQAPKHVMKSVEEALMFRRYNYARQRLTMLQRTIKNGGLTRALATDFELWFGRMMHDGNYIIRSNLSLVLAMIRRSGHVSEYAEQFSEGNMAMYNSLKKFDVDRGFKFSTYCCRSILRLLSRSATKHRKKQARFPCSYDGDFEKGNIIDARRNSAVEESREQLVVIINHNLAELSEVEMNVIRYRFNWSEENDKALTLEEVGRIVGVTKERIRQIQNKALVKIRKYMDLPLHAEHPSANRKGPQKVAQPV